MRKRRRITRTGTPAQRAWWFSSTFREMGRANCQRINRRRGHLPLCGAMKRSTGDPCGNLAMANGRCRLHGGATPKADAWHLPKWPDRNSPRAIEKMSAKLADRERQARQRQRRLAKMTPDERAAYERWRREHPPGSAGARATDRAYRQQDREMRERFARYAAEDEAAQRRAADPRPAWIPPTTDEVDIFA